jgi:signal transduction histidine kinase
MDSSTQIGLYRIIQEALTNVARHSQARVVSIVFDWRDPLLRVLIRDNGAGFRSRNVGDRPSKHLGIEGMRQQALMLGGTFNIASEPNKGTSIEVQLTLPETRENAENPKSQ